MSSDRFLHGGRVCRAIAATGLCALLACGTPNSGPGARPLDHPAAVVEQPIATVDDAQGAAVVEVTSQRCRVPTVNRGVGTWLGDGYVLTAAHLVDRELRHLRVNGADAQRVALDHQLDLAIVRVPSGIESGPSAPIAPRADDVTAGPVSIVTVDGVIDTEILRSVVLRVDHVSNHSISERLALELAGAVERGTSGAPVHDADGVVVGIVVLSHPARGLPGAVAYAVAIDADILGGLHAPQVNASSRDALRIGCPPR